ncbi:Uncharacterised protein [Candidatus Venteria ishoeyi]|uniref:Uncharacterized protein n=1 Tax=Candidatus Venteria ishoeyi TaxID=1899563 RepID=A0A1H6F6W7_9GAMM|nr:Uncharacterised protein [Candidatus Venteria ishoeyi]
MITTPLSPPARRGGQKPVFMSYESLKLMALGRCPSAVGRISDNAIRHSPPASTPAPPLSVFRHSPLYESMVNFGR